MRCAEAGFDLEIDLTRGSIERVATELSSFELYLGGQGAAEQILWDRVSPEVEPFSPDNLLIFSAGLLAATPVPGANRTSVSSIDPQSNLYANSGLGGFFGPELKYAGYDKIVVCGKASDLVYVWINDDRVEIRDARHLQGKSALETTALIRKELKDDKVQVAAIGLAGENRVSQASIDHGNTSASRGVGVVMGDKRLKAVAVRGTRDIKVAQPAELFEICNRLYQEIYDNPKCGDVLLRQDDDSCHIGNSAWNKVNGEVKGFWTTELQQAWEVRVESESVSLQWENYSQEYEEVRETIVDRSRLLRGTGCFNCPKNCHQAVSLPGQRMYFLKNYGRLAYAMATYGELRLNYDVLAAMQEYGLDEFSMPQVVVFAIRLYEAGILSNGDLPDFPQDAVARFSYLVEIIAKRDGIGDALANGVYSAARQIGRGAEAYAHTAKKIEQVPVPQDQANYAYFLMYATGEKMNITQIEGSFPQSPIPDRTEREEFVSNWNAAPERFKKWFLEWEPDQQSSTEAVVNIADWNEAMHYVDDALGVCPLLSSFRGQFGGRPPFHINNLPQLIALTTGLDIDADELWRIAARNRNLVRAFNVRRGLRRVDDQLPKNLWDARDPEREHEVLDAYYEFKGWTGDGIPSRETLDRLGLNYVTEDFKERGLIT